jgi:hypothetical protein
MKKITLLFLIFAIPYIVKSQEKKYIMKKEKSLTS